ncbi:restriction endonuclease subunit S [Psychrobacillus psychrotolerans]|uniref:restriction endonuclease subunit S n=1 Tax=Psychrobacillus psychrotolerans TaxID=126156 RepID=UPI003B022DD1
MENKKLPEVRFEEFSGDWKESKFFDLYKITSGYAFKMSDYSKTGITIINGESIQHNKIESNNFKYLPENFKEKYSQILLQTGDIVIGLNRPITNGLLKIARIPRELSGSILYQRAGKIEYKQRISHDFSFVLLSKEILKFTLKEAVGSDQPFISTTKLSEWDFKVPVENEEQEKIGYFFKQLDDTIVLHQQELDRLKQTKQGFLQKMFPKEGQTVPELRFPGFAGDWARSKLDSIVNRVRSYSLSREVETIENTGYKYIHYGDIHTKVADKINESSNLPNIIGGEYELLNKGDLVLADASEDYQGVATPAVITIDVPYKLVAGLHTIALRPKHVDSLFLYYLINSPIFRKYGYKVGTGMKVFGISVTNLLKFESMFPQLQEQTKIGSFFKQLDDTIALHQRELDVLKETKKAFLQKMFI